jgi:PAS domain S-box-containing protein
VELTLAEMYKVLDACHDGIYICDETLRAIWVNTAFERITGISREVWTTYNVYELLDKHMVDDSVVRRVYEQKQQVTILQKYETNRIALLTGEPIYAETIGAATDQTEGGATSEITKIVVTARDITDIRLLSDELDKLRKQNERVKHELLSIKHKAPSSIGLVYASKEMGRIVAMCHRVSAVDSTVLLLGESGVGKEMLARLVHQSSPRSDKPFVAIDCGAIPKDLLESELFGYVSGSFTGASKGGKAGLFEQGNGGTVFLDEIGDLSLDLQVKLLRVLQERQIRRIGGTTPIELNVRFIAATNKQLQQLVQTGDFREDLYYRLHVIPITIPPLRDRQEDIHILINHFVDLYNNLYGLKKYFHFDTITLLTKYTWPGNVRELQNLVERLLITSEGNDIVPKHLPPTVQPVHSSRPMLPSNLPLKSALENLEIEMLQHALQTHPTAEKAAGALGISQPTMVRRMQKYQLKVISEYL